MAKISVEVKRPEDRLVWHIEAQIGRYEWALQVDPEAVAKFEQHAAEQRKGATRIASS
jgi:hypothetical protein